MHHATRHLRGLMVALAALALSAGVVLASRPATAPPAAADGGLLRASEAAGKVVPVSTEAPAVPEVDDEAQAEETVEPEADETAQPETDATDAERAQNHGWFVSEAAKGETPEGFDNHGAYVSSIAKGDDGKPEAASTGQQKATDAKATKPDKSSKAKGD